MRIRRSHQRIEILAPAKVNLFFEVLGKRDDGFHEIETLMVPIRLFDTLVLQNEPSGKMNLDARWAHGWTGAATAAGQFELAQDPTSRSEVESSFETIPQGESNLAVRAIRLLAKHAGIDRGAKLTLIKRIPTAAGLGGGSSDAAAALAAANLLWDLNWPTEQLAALAAELGSDVPFFVIGGAAICRGRGEKIEPIATVGLLHIVLVKPPLGLSTPAVYRACRPPARPCQIDPVVSALRRGELAALGPRTMNRLTDPARHLSSTVEEVLSLLADQSCPVVGMSGSGTSCFALCRSARHARKVAARVQARLGYGSLVWNVRSI